jgi:hypothetical protein
LSTPCPQPYNSGFTGREAILDEAYGVVVVTEQLLDDGAATTPPPLTRLWRFLTITG